MKHPLIFPEKILEQHLVVLGKTGAGKSSALRHIVEHLLAQKKRVCVIDPKGDWWGLKVGADGKSAGLSVVLFGDFKNETARDVPVNDRSGSHIAELIATGNRPCVIGMRGWTQGAMTRFWIDFASTVFAHNAGELFLVADEVHNFAPKGKIMSPQAGESLHWSNRLLSEGRGLGLVCLIASQRPQKVHNDTLTSCETLVAMRVIHKADRDAVEDWIKGAGDPALGREVLNTLASMPRGEAFVWSPEVGFGPKRLAFPMFTTFDSFAPPQLQMKVSEQGWADVDLAEVEEKLAAVIEDAKANDPRELKKEIAELKLRLKSQAPVVDESAIERAVSAAVSARDNEWQRRTELIERNFEEVKDRIEKIAELAHLNGHAALPPAPVTVAPARLSPRPASPARVPAPARARVAPSGDVNLGKGERAILTAVAQHAEGVTREQLTVLTGYKRSSRDTYLQRLYAQNCVATSGHNIIATDEGVAALGSDFEPLPTGDALLRYWLDRLSGGERFILETVAGVYPNAIDRDKLSEVTDYKRSSRDTYLQRLAARKLVIPEARGMVRASELLFD